MNQNLLIYKKNLLKKSLKASNDFNHKEMEIIAYCLRDANNMAKAIRTYTKDELYVYGLSAFEIHRYFTPADNFQWKLKRLIIINDNVIESLDELKKELNLKIAS